MLFQQVSRGIQATIKMSFNFQSRDFKMGVLYGRLWEIADSNSYCDFDEFINAVNDLFSSEGFQVESWEMMEDLVGLFYSGDTDEVMINGVKCLKLEDLEHYCSLEDGKMKYVRP